MGEAERAVRGAGRKAEQAASKADRHPALRSLARAGYVANGIVHLVIAGIAVGVAVGAGGGSADQSGAMQAIASTPLGVVVLWLVVVAMLGLAVAAVVEGVAARRTEGAGELAKGVGKAIAYGAVAGAGLSAVLGGGGGGGDQQVESVSATVMATPVGAIGVGVAGAVVVAIGVVFVAIGVRRSFLEHIAPPQAARRFATALGVIGYVAKGVAVGIVGVLLVVAAWTNDPDEAAGLDGALKSLRELPFGSAVLLIVAVGIGAYGVFCVARAAWPSR